MSTEAENIVIESTLSVHMDWDVEGQNWTVTDNCLSDYPLDMAGDGVYSDHGKKESLSEAAQTEWDKAEITRLPTGPELGLMLLNGGILPNSTQEIGEIISTLLIRYELIQDHRAKLAEDAARPAA